MACILCIARVSPSILTTCPIQRSLLLLMMFPIPSCPLLSHISLLVILSLQEICNILVSHLLCAASSFLPFATVIGQVSEPYSSVPSTTASYSLILVFRGVNPRRVGGSRPPDFGVGG